MSGSSLFDLTGKVALITGSSRGIGRAIAEQMAACGARVVISSRKQEACDVVAAKIRENGGEAIAVACNVSHKEQLERLVAEVEAVWGRIDILVCNAAANPHFGSLRELPDSAMDKVIAANIKSIVWLCNLTAPKMAQRKDGAIIIISSIGGFVGSDVAGIYNMSKAAEQSLTRTLAVEWGSSNVRVNCIAPGPVRTDFAEKIHQQYADKPVASPLARIGEPIEIAGAAIYFASTASSYTTGQTLCVDGGRLIHKLRPD